MTDRKHDLHAAFRLNLEQQRNRAKDLLKSARSGNPPSLVRLMCACKRDFGAADLKLAHAQRAIAHELGFTRWAALKAHIAAMDAARRAMTSGADADKLDKDAHTLHVRCGSDIRSTLRDAGFAGDFLEHSYPYCHGPTTVRADHFELEAQFLAGFATPQQDLSLADALQWRHRQEADLAASAARYERIVLWMEHDCFDQLVLVRCLAHYATTQRPRVLELIDVGHFPGSIRFLGLGQLPPEGLRLLWQQRKRVDDAQLRLASETWRALTAETPVRLAAIARRKTLALQHLRTALRRQLAEHPAVANGLGMTERLILQTLLDGALPLYRLFESLTYERDPLPFATDLSMLEVIARLEGAPRPLLHCADSTRPWERVATITDLGRAVLAGQADWLALTRAERWVGGVHIRPHESCWRWDEGKADVRFTDPATLSTP